MATLTFTLKNPQNKTSPIIAMLTDGRDYKIKLYPGYSIPTKTWSKKNKCVSPSYRDAVAVNSYLDQYRSDVLQVFLHAKTNGLVRKQMGSNGNEYFPKAQYFKTEVEKLRYLRSEIAHQKESFWDLWDLFLRSREDSFKQHTFKKYEYLEAHLKAFEKASISLDLDLLSESHLDDFQAFCYTKRKLNTQSTAKYIGLLKAFLNWCVKRKHTTNTDFRNFKSIRQPDSLKVIITKDELQRIEKLNLSDQLYLHNARQLFILSCETGLRFSDYSKIKGQHLKRDSDGSYILVMRLQKSDHDVEIPLTNKALTIIQDLIAGNLHSISNQKMNEYVKTIARKAKLNEQFETFRYVGRNKEIAVKFKHELITTHTGRRTYATNLLNRGVSAQTVMKFTGHKDYKSFEKYVNIPKQVEKELIKKAQMDGYMTVSA